MQAHHLLCMEICVLIQINIRSITLGWQHLKNSELLPFEKKLCAEGFTTVKKISKGMQLYWLPLTCIGFIRYLLETI